MSAHPIARPSRLARRRTRGAARGTNRRGMTLVEVLVAVTILGGALLSLAAYVGQFARTVSDSDATARAAELAAERLETVKGSTSYGSMDSLYTETQPAAIAGEARFKRQTLIRRVGGGDGDLDDYRVVTVIISSTLLKKPVRRTTVVSDF